MGVQPMSGPTGLIFSMKAHSTDVQGNVVNDLYGPGKTPNPKLGGQFTSDAGATLDTDAESMPTGEGELLGSNKAVAGGADPVYQVSPWAEMSFTIDQTSVEARTKALKARYTHELAHDLRQIHGLDAETELANLMSTELTAEINREVVDTVFAQAVQTLKTSEGAGNYDHASATGYDFFDYNGIGILGAAEGVYDLNTHSGGRWEQEHYKNIIGIINKVAHEVALGTRRGLGNFVITTPSVAAALDMASGLNPTEPPRGGAQMNNDNVGITYAGRLLGRYDVYVDPYRATDDILVGYKGANAYDAGYYYCPYVPLTMMKAQGEDDFNPRIGFKTRYGMKNNPFTSGTAGQNWYFRKFSVLGV